MVSGRRIYESDDENPVPQDKVKTEQCETGVEELSTTQKFGKSIHDNRVLITLWIAILTFAGTQMLSARDSTQQQPLVDKMQDFRIEQNEEHLMAIDQKLDRILERLPK